MEAHQAEGCRWWNFSKLWWFCILCHVVCSIESHRERIQQFVWWTIQSTSIYARVYQEKHTLLAHDDPIEKLLIVESQEQLQSYARLLAVWKVKSNILVRNIPYRVFIQAFKVQGIISQDLLTLPPDAELFGWLSGMQCCIGKGNGKKETPTLK